MEFRLYSRVPSSWNECWPAILLYKAKIQAQLMFPKPVLPAHQASTPSQGSCPIPLSISKYGKIQTCYAFPNTRPQSHNSHIGAMPNVPHKASPQSTGAHLLLDRLSRNGLPYISIDQSNLPPPPLVSTSRELAQPRLTKLEKLGMVLNRSSIFLEFPSQ